MHFSLLLLGHGKHISYLIATDSRSYEDGMHCAKLKSNLHGTKFILYDNGAKRYANAKLQSGVSLLKLPSAKGHMEVYPNEKKSRMLFIRKRHGQVHDHCWPG